LASPPLGLVRRLQPNVDREVIAVVASPSDTLVQQFLTDVHYRGLPTWPGPN
jgi:hypothetical protein